MNDPLDELSPENIASFREGCEKKTLSAGTVLHRFTSGNDQAVFSDCWIDDQTFRGIFDDLANMASSLGASSQAGKKRVLIWEAFAILTSWNKLSNRVKISLKKDVVAYVGKTGPQSIHMALDQRNDVTGTPSQIHGKAIAPFSGIVTELSYNRGGVNHLLLRGHSGRFVQHFDNLSRVDVKLNARVEKGAVLGQSVRVTKVGEYRRGGFDQIIIPRFRKDEDLRKIREKGENEAATIILNQLIF